MVCLISYSFFLQIYVTWNHIWITCILINLLTLTNNCVFSILGPDVWSKSEAFQPSHVKWCFWLWPAGGRQSVLWSGSFLVKCPTLSNAAATTAAATTAWTNWQYEPFLQSTGQYLYVQLFEHCGLKVSISATRGS